MNRVEMHCPTSHFSGSAKPPAEFHVRYEEKMPTFKRYELQSEKELHGIIQSELDSLEEGLELLKYEMTIGKGIPDFLCRDSGGRLVIIDVKLQENENILFQALRYYADVNKNRYVIAEIFSQKNVDPKQSP